MDLVLIIGSVYILGSRGVGKNVVYEGVLCPALLYTQYLLWSLLIPESLLQLLPLYFLSTSLVSTYSLDFV
jgi:hypothetical protein